MARTTILPTDPNKRKAWCAQVAEDSAHTQYFARLEGEEGSDAIVVRKTETEKGATDEVVTALVAKLRGTPITEGKKLEGAEFKLSTAAHTMRINEFRQGVNVGARIEQSRVGFNLKKQGREKLTTYIGEMYEELIAMAASGARGTGNEISHFSTDWTGYPNAFRAPDAAHYFVGVDNSHTGGPGGTMVAGDKMSLAAVNKLRTKAKKMLGGQPDQAVRIAQTSKGGKKCYVLAVMPEVMQDIRDDVGTAGWFDAQRALTTQVGKDSEIFKGGAGMFNGVLIDEFETGVKFNNYGAGSNVAAARSLFMGANAIVTAHGTKGLADGMTVALTEDTDDRGHDFVLDFEIIFGADKAAFNGLDYGMVTVDTAFTASV
jgi:N4-gp56 family major capsid protein